MHWPLPDPPPLVSVIIPTRDHGDLLRCCLTSLAEHGQGNPPTEIILIDHTGGRVLDAAAYFAGHGFTAVKGLKGGIDAYSSQADPSLPRYTTEAEIGRAHV